MESIIRVCNRRIIVPHDLNNAEIFIGKWRKAQNKAVEEAIKLTNNDIKEYNFDKLVDELTIEYYVKGD
tara:strand:- start:402 stop:608 length:207 start_codon:yes stop_codon:yes gene_type:complete